MSIKPREWQSPYRSWSKPKSKLTRGGIKPVSAKRVKINKIYSALRKKFLIEHPYCQLWLSEHGLVESDINACGVIQWNNGFNVFWKRVPKSEEIHHQKGRGKYLLDITTWMAVSSSAHRWLHDNVKEAYEKGWMLPRN